MMVVSSEIPLRDEGAPGNRAYLNRELSWLDFDARVLALAEDPSLPLLERVKFLAIFNGNLDEFFQVRVAILRNELESGAQGASIDGHSPVTQLAAIREKVLELVARAEVLFQQELRPRLAEAGIAICDWENIEPAEQAALGVVFDRRVFPVLTPLAVGPAQPFPYVSNLSFNLAVQVRDSQSGIVRFARVKIPPAVDRFVDVGDGRRFVPIEQLIAAHLDRLFPGMIIESQCTFRVTRDADLDIQEDEADDLLVAVETELQRQHRLSDAVRLEVDANMPARAREVLLAALHLDPQGLYVRSAPLNLGDLRQIAAFERPDLKFPNWLPRPVPAIAGLDEDGSRTIFDLLKQGEIFVHHPYDSFDNSVGAFLATAADDPNVLSIKHAIYRTAAPQQNAIGRTLIRAAQSGKQVVTLVELKARFDERANIDWARKLEDAGVHVVYGQLGLKTHAKVALVVRQESDGIRRYCHVGTGNYNAVTARIYEDVGLFSASPELGADLSELFNHLTGFSNERTYRRLLVAPHGLRSALLDLIRKEAGASDGSIVIKVNNLSDPGLIDALYEASRAGTRVDLIVRSICCLRAGVPGLSENIRVRSVLGPFLEHSRLFRFGSEARGYDYLAGSADLMPRNLDRRVEVLVSIDDARHRKRIDEVLHSLLSCDRMAWELTDSHWQRAPTGPGSNAQEELMRSARSRADEDSSI